MAVKSFQLRLSRALLVAGVFCHAQAFNFNLLKTPKIIQTFISKGTSRALPDFQQLLQITNTIADAETAMFLSDSLNKACVKMIKAGLKSKDVDVAMLRVELRAGGKRYSYRILEADKLAMNPAFDISKKVVLVVSGFTTTINNSDPIDALEKAFKCRTDVNFLAFDPSNYMTSDYTTAAWNTKIIGQHLAESLRYLVDVVPIANIHLIGHSLGANIVGAAGRAFKKLYGKQLPRISALDPARPCFFKNLKLLGVTRYDAAFVDVIHTTPGMLGREVPVGVADFYPNGLAPVYPNCVDLSCAHALSWRFYAESVYSSAQSNFVAKSCEDFEQVRKYPDDCGGEEAIMGYAASPDKGGVFYLTVNKESPYGQNFSAMNVEVCSE